MNFGIPGWGCDEEAAADILDAYLAAGGNFVDTADIYGGGESERILGRLLAGRRDTVILASKVGFPSPRGGPAGLSPANIRTSLHESLKRLRTDYLDLYQLHAFDTQVPMDETLGVLHTLVDEGLVRYAGTSNFFAWQVANADGIAWHLGLRPLASMQMMYNLVRRDIEREHLAYAQLVQLAVIAYGPLHGGHLAAAWRSRADVPPNSRAGLNSDVYLSDQTRLFAVTEVLVAHAEQLGATPGQVALAWVLQNPAITVGLTAARSARELEEQLVAIDLEADRDFWSSLDRATALPESYPDDFYRRISTRNSSDHPTL
jgi:aryl-alcohol dehydrogenase-like predicted oxidoreductase